MRRRTIALLLSAMMMLGLSACGGTQSGNDAQPSQNTGSAVDIPPVEDLTGVDTSSIPGLEDGVLTQFEQVHLGFACDTPRGLLVPVIRSAQALGLKAFSDEAKRLAGGAIDGTIAPDFLSGGTFTVSNIGSFGIETFTPVINLPQTAILGVGAITPRPTVAADGSIGVEQRLNLSLTIDHQVIDGADGARFLRDLVAAIENIDVTVLA